MSQTVTLQAALVLTTTNGQRFSIPSGTVVTLPDANNLDDAAEIFRGNSAAGYGANKSQFDRVGTSASGVSGVTDGDSYQIGHDAQGGKYFRDLAKSASPSRSLSASPSASPSRSPSAS